MSDFQFLTTVKNVAEEFGMEVKVNMYTHHISFVGDYPPEKIEACIKMLQDIFQYAGTIKTLNLGETGHC